MLLAVGLSLGGVGTWLIPAREDIGRGGVLIVVVPFQLLFGGPSEGVVPTTLNWAFEGAAVRLEMFVQVAVSRVVSVTHMANI